MRIGDPARKHGITDPDIWHTVRHVMRLVAMDEDLMMLIGPATTQEVTTMTRQTDTALEQAAHRFAQLADHLDPAAVHVDSTEDLEQIAAASEAARADQARLREAVDAARARGRSWNLIAAALGVSRQAARQRFADKLPA